MNKFYIKMFILSIIFLITNMIISGVNVFDVFFILIDIILIVVCIKDLKNDKM